MAQPSSEAIALCQQSDVIDLHIDSFIWRRIVGYDLHKRHGRGMFGGRFYSQVDIPRLREASVDAATWVITTNPFRTAQGRAKALRRNVMRLRDELGRSQQVTLVSTAADYDHAKRDGKHAAFVGLQGGNAFGVGPFVAALRVPPAFAIHVEVSETTPRCDLWSARASLGPDLLFQGDHRPEDRLRFQEPRGGLQVDAHRVQSGAAIAPEQGDFEKRFHELWPVS